MLLFTVPATEFLLNCPSAPVTSLMLEHSLSSSVDLVGLQLWRGALLLADYILDTCHVFSGTRVLELAAGTGLTSVTAAMFANTVTATDVDRGKINFHRVCVSKL